jgi:hypothetical protein
MWWKRFMVNSSNILMDTKWQLWDWLWTFYHMTFIEHVSLLPMGFVWFWLVLSAFYKFLSSHFNITNKAVARRNWEERERERKFHSKCFRRIYFIFIFAFAQNFLTNYLSPTQRNNKISGFRSKLKLNLHFVCR